MNESVILSTFILATLILYINSIIQRQKIDKLNNIIKEVREYITKHIEDKKYLNNIYSDKSMLEIILEILDKENRL